jgi:polyhydroxyalkanoate synthesis regulator phasin
MEQLNHRLLCKVNDMVDEKRGTKTKSTAAPRESDDPIAEEFREELLQKPSFSARSVGRLISDEDRLSRTEGRLTEMQQRIDLLEKRVHVLEAEARK